MLHAYDANTVRHVCRCITQHPACVVPLAGNMRVLTCVKCAQSKPLTLRARAHINILVTCSARACVRFTCSELSNNAHTTATAIPMHIPYHISLCKQRRTHVKSMHRNGEGSAGPAPPHTCETGARARCNINLLFRWGEHVRVLR